MYTVKRVSCEGEIAVKETYESMEIEIQVLPQEDVITASEIMEHDNYFLSFNMFE